MLTNTQKRQLKSLSSTIDTKYQLGKNEITDTLVNMLDKALTAHELIKVDVMKNAPSPIMELALDLSAKLNAEIVHTVGRVIVLFRQIKEKDKQKIKLVK